MSMASLLQSILNIHIALSIIGQLVFTISFCASLLFIIKHNNLKRKKIASGKHTTSLSLLEKIIVKSSYVGFCFITLALITGLIVMLFSKNFPQMDFIKMFWSFFVWTWFIIVIFGRNLWGWKGRTGAQLIVVGSIILILGLFVNFYFYL